MLNNHGWHVRSHPRHLPVQGQQAPGKVGGSARHARPLLREAARATPEGAPGRGGRGHGAQADRAAGPGVAEAGRQVAGPGQGRAGAGQRGPGPRGAGAPGRAGRAAGRAQDPARPDQRPGAEARPDVAGAPDPGRALPHAEGDDEGLLHRGRGPDQGGRGGVGDLGLHAQRGRHYATGSGQDRRHAGAGGRHRRAARLRCARRPDASGRRHPEGARQGVVDVPGGQRAGGAEGRAGHGRWRRHYGRAARGGTGRRRRYGRYRRRKRLMAISRNIKPDRGLTYRMFLTGFLLVLLYGLVVGVLIAVGLSYSIVLVLAVVLIFCQYWFSAKIAMYAMHAKEVTPEQAPELHGVVDRLCALADMPKPKVAIATTDIPNAFATGRSPKSSVVCVTSGLLRRLDEPEVEAVLSHEISHVAHRDVAVMTIASGLGMLAGLLTRVMFYSEIFGGGRGGGNNQQSQAALVEMLVLLVSVVVYFVSFLLTMALSRYRELAADRSGALLIGRPSLLASALVKITGEMGRIPTKDLRAAEPFNAFFFTPAVATGGDQGTGGGFSFGNLFRTHPTLERRLAPLDSLERQVGQAG